MECARGNFVVIVSLADFMILADEVVRQCSIPPFVAGARAKSEPDLVAPFRRDNHREAVKVEGPMLSSCEATGNWNHLLVLRDIIRIGGLRSFTRALPRHPHPSLRLRSIASVQFCRE